MVYLTASDEELEKIRGAPGEASAVRRLAAACFLRRVFCLRAWKKRFFWKLLPWKTSCSI
ncbi:MAG: hypothetical protein ACLR2E_06380 [Lachnospiraceae bacterium]